MSGGSLTPLSRSYQAECFTPKRTLGRSPPSTPQAASTVDENTSPVHSVPNKSCPIRTTPSRDDQPVPSLSTEYYQMGDGVLREVQDPCFTPRRSLQRSPPTNPKSVSKKEGDLPPKTHWEIPRTPVQLRPSTPVQYQQFQVQPPTDRFINRGTPIRTKTPTHPLSHSNKASPITNGLFSKSAEDPNDENTAPFMSDSRPISIAKDMPTLPAFECTENDLAYLEHVKNVKQLAELKSRDDHLIKAQTKATVEIELLEHESKKIDSDVQNIKTRVQSVTTTVQQLVARDNVAPKESDLCQSTVAELKRVNQRTAVELERAEREAKGKMSEVDKTVDKLNKDIHSLESEQAEEKESLQSDLQSTQEQLSKLETRRQQVSLDHQTAQNELQSLQSELAKINLSEAPGEEGDREEEKEQLEQRLTTMVRRCELYVRRHKMLQEMGI